MGGDPLCGFMRIELSLDNAEDSEIENLIL